MKKIISKILSVEDKPNNYKVIKLLGLKLAINPLYITAAISKGLDRIIPKQKNKIVFNSYPDFSDNPLCFYNYLLEKHPGEYDIIWISSSSVENIFPKNTKGYRLYTLKGLFHIFSAKYIISNHCNDLVNMIHSKSHVWLNLWHGMPLKTLGVMEKNISSKNLHRYEILKNSAYQFVTSDIFKLSMISCFLINPNRVFITGQPRTDCVLAGKNKDKIKNILHTEKYNKVILYAPTYKEAQRNNGIREIDQVFDNIFYLKDYSEEDFLKFLEDNSILFIVKPHPIDEKFYKNLEDNNTFNHPNIKIIYEQDLSKNNLYFYEFFSLSDLMITDFSSIALDYLIAEKPVIFLNSLSEEYNKNRGFILEDNYEQLMLGDKVSDFKQLLNSIAGAILTDSWNKNKLSNISLIHKFRDNGSSERIYQIMKGL